MRKRIAQLIINNRLYSIALSMLLTIAFVLGCQHLSLVTDVRAYYAEDDPYLIALDHIESTYIKNDIVMIVVSPNEGSVFSTKALQVVADITEQSWQFPHSIRVDSLTNYQNTSPTGDDLEVADLFEDIEALNPAQILAKENSVFREPRLPKYIVAEDKKSTAVVITTAMPGLNATSELSEVVTFARDLVKQIEANHPDYTFRLAGQLMLNNAFAESSKTDLKTLYPLMILLILLALWILFRRVSLVISIFVVIILSCGAAMGAIGWASLSIAPNAIAAPVIIITLAIADCIHILNTYRQEIIKGLSNREAMANSLALNISPIVLTSVSTAIGFLALNLASSPPFQVFGNIVAIGVMFALLLSIFFLAPLVSFFKTDFIKERVKFSSYLNKTVGYIFNNRVLLVGLVALITSVSVFGLLKNEITDSSVEFFNYKLPIRHDMEYVNEHLTGVHYIAYSIASNAPTGISDPEYLQVLDRFAIWLRLQRGVVHVSSITDTFKQLNRDMHAGDEQWYKIPEDASLAAQYLLLYELSLPLGKELTNQVNFDKTASKINVRIRKSTSNEIIDLDLKVQDWLSENASNLQWSEGGSRSLIFAYLSRRNVITMTQTLLLGMLFVSIAFGVIYSSFRLALLGLATSIVPTVISLGLWGVFVGKIGLGVSVVLGIFLGMIVDNTVHFLAKYADAQKNLAMSTNDAARHAFTTVTPAILGSNSILVIGFMVLALSSYSPNSDMGLLTAMGLCISVVTALILLPSLLFNPMKKS